MTQMLPITVAELNMLHYTQESSLSTAFKKPDNHAIISLPVDRKLKKELSLPGGLENWNIGSYESYLNFDDNAIMGGFDTLSAAIQDDGIVPEGNIKTRCPSISSVSSFVDDPRPVYNNLGVKTFSTVCMDSGSTCISSEQSIIESSATLQEVLDAGETFQNLDVFLQEVPEMTINPEPIPASYTSLPSTSSSDSSLEFTVLQNFKPLRNNSQDSLVQKTYPLKRRLESNSEDDVFISKQSKEDYGDSVDSYKYQELRRKNNLASKNCRKTRKEKQKEMESRASELEQENETLRVEVQKLEELIQALKTHLLNAIVQKR